MRDEDDRMEVTPEQAQWLQSQGIPVHHTILRDDIPTTAPKKKRNGKAIRKEPSTLFEFRELPMHPEGYLNRFYRQVHNVFEQHDFARMKRCHLVQLLMPLNKDVTEKTIGSYVSQMKAIGALVEVEPESTDAAHDPA